MKQDANLRWQPPPDWMRINALDMHTGGEPLRVITGGLPPIPGANVLEKRRWFREHLDHIRTGLMWEPRGHADMYGAVVTPASDDADYDVFFLHNEGYSTMCGHAIIALARLVADTGGGETIRFNVPAGRINARYSPQGSSFRNVPSFVLYKEETVDVPGMGAVTFDVAYGGAFYAFVAAEQLGLKLIPSEVGKHIDYGRRIKHAVMDHFPITHPFEPDLSFLYGTIFTGSPHDGNHHSRNVCVFADGEIDRSATGSGVSARAALHFAKGELELEQRITIESIIGTTMTVAAVERCTFGPYDAVIPEVSGTASYVGRHEFFFDPADPLKAGFLVR